MNMATTPHPTTTNEWVETTKHVTCLSPFRCLGSSRNSHHRTRSCCQMTSTTGACKHYRTDLPEGWELRSGPDMEGVEEWQYDELGFGKALWGETLLGCRDLFMVRAFHLPDIPICTTNSSLCQNHSPAFTNPSRSTAQAPAVCSAWYAPQHCWDSWAPWNHQSWGLPPGSGFPQVVGTWATRQSPTWWCGCWAYLWWCNTKCMCTNLYVLAISYTHIIYINIYIFIHTLNNIYGNILKVHVVFVLQLCCSSPSWQGPPVFVEGKLMEAIYLQRPFFNHHGTTLCRNVASPCKP